MIVAASFVVYSNYKVKSLDTFKMYFGASDLDQKSDSDVISSGVWQIIQNENYKAESPQEANVALLIADKIIVFSSQIRPACFWPFRHDSDDIIEASSIGYTVGWGFDDNRTHTKKKKFIQMKVDKRARCNSSFKYELLKVVFDQFFCASATSKGTPCYTDGPLYMKSDDKWFLRGLLSTNKYWPNNNTCAVGSPILYTDISFCSEWIATKMSSS